MRRLWTAGGGCMVVVLIGVVVLSIVGGIAIGIAAVVAPNFLNGIVGGILGVEVVQTRPVAGDPARYDPIAGFPAMRAFAGEGAQLVEFRADYVRSDGTLDLTATYVPSPRVRAVMLLPAPRPENAPPVGAGGLGTWYRRVTIDAYRPGQASHVSTRGPTGRFSYSYVNDGMTRQIDAAAAERNVAILEPPTCSFQELWRIAREHGAPTDAVAVIDYDEDGYELIINDVNFTLELDRACKVRSGSGR